MPPNSTMARLSHEGIDAASRVLGAAAVDDPSLASFVPSAADRSQAVINFFRAAMTLGTSYGEVWTIGNPLAGVSWWTPPLVPNLKPETFEAAGFTPDGLNWRQEWFDRFTAFRVAITEQIDRLDEKPHLHLRWIGVDPELQGSGLGSTLIRHTIQNADEYGVECTLFNFVPRNIAMYERFGFCVISDTILSDTGLRLWTMSRPVTGQGS